jgi:uncharacterized protein (UPF0261 family)
VARGALFDAIREHEAASRTELDLHLNDPAFAEAAAGMLIDLMNTQGDEQ